MKQALSGPATPEYGGGVPKSWSSERAANPSIRGHGSGGAALIPFNSGRALPSKWDDADRWITSPVSSYGSANAIPRRPMSKSGPLGPSGTSSRDEKTDGAAKEQRDMATQMSTVSRPDPFHQNDVPASRDEVRDVQVDKGITTAGQSEKQGVREMKDSSHAQNINPLPWNASEESKDTSKLQREEAKITAWENLQKAKAETAVRKLEMKLEKKRSASMDSIMNKLRASEMRARAMRNLLSENDAPEAHTTSSHGGFSFSKYVKMHLHSNCLVCRRN